MSSIGGMNSTVSYFKKYDAREHKALYKTPHTRYVFAREESQAVSDNAAQIDAQITDRLEQLTKSVFEKSPISTVFEYRN